MTKRKPVLSVITVNFNNAQNLEKTILSVLSQPGITTSNFEYIIIDGGSSDNSAEIIKKYASSKKYGKYISFWCSEKDGGIYEGLNKGLAHANGSLIGLMHSGDTYQENVFADILEEHKKVPDAILYGALKAYADGEFQSIWGVNHNYLPKQMIPHLSTFVPKAVYDKYGTFDESFRIAGDYELFLRFYTNKVQFHFVDKIICNFNLEGVSQKQTENTQIETDNVKKKYGFYIPIPKKQIRRQKIKNFIKKLLPFLAG